jgi:purine catabolism regulator
VTDRPRWVRCDNRAVLTVGEVLELPVIKRGLPEVVAGEEHLDRRVRWAHVVDVAEVSGLLKGGEFVLNNGFGIGLEPRTQRAFIRELAEQDVSAVAVELGLLYERSLPPAMATEAQRVELPLIALHRKTRFVEVTEAVHQRLMSEELVSLRLADELSQSLTDLSLAGADVSELLDEAARSIGNPIVFEDASKRMITVAAAQSSEEIVLRAWRDRLEQEARTPEASRGALEAPVRLVDGPWGRLIALELDGPFEELAQTLLERAASALALRLVSQHQVNELAARSRGALIDDLVAGRLGEQEAARRAEALGFQRQSKRLLPIAMAWRGAGSERADSNSWVALAPQLRSALARVGMAALIGPYGDRLVLIVEPVREGESETLIESVATAIYEGAGHQQLTQEELAVSVGPAAERWNELGVGLDYAARHVLVAAREPPALWHDARRVSLDDVLTEMGNSTTLRAFLHDRLGPLADDVTDRRHVELLRTLEAYLSHGGHKTAAAHALHLERRLERRRSPARTASRRPCPATAERQPGRERGRGAGGWVTRHRDGSSRTRLKIDRSPDPLFGCGWHRALEDEPARSRFHTFHKPRSGACAVARPGADRGAPNATARTQRAP